MNNFFTYPLRIFFLNSAVFVIIASVVLAFNLGDFVALHKFIFLQSFLGAAFAGFLLTALPLWCEIEVNRKPFSIALFVILWVAFLSCALIDESLGYAIMSAFWFVLFLVALFWIIKAKNTANLILIFALLGLFALSAVQIFMREVRFAYAFIHLCALATLIVSFRVSLVLGNEAIKSLPNSDSLMFIPNVALKNISCFLVFALIIATIWDKSANLNAFLSLGVGFSLMSRLSQWHYRIFFTTHYTLILYALFLGFSASYIALGVAYFANAYISSAMHFLNIFVILGFVLFIFNVASLRHTANQIFIFSLLTRISFVALLLSAISRGILMNFAGIFYITIPAILVAFAFVYFIAKFLGIYKNNDFKADD